MQTPKRLIATAIQTKYNPPPIPDRSYDWEAWRVGYELGDPIGNGETELEAIKNLIEQETERHE